MTRFDDRHLRRRPAAALSLGAVGLALVLAGCGSASGTSSGGAGNAPATKFDAGCSAGCGERPACRQADAESRDQRTQAETGRCETDPASRPGRARSQTRRGHTRSRTRRGHTRSQTRRGHTSPETCAGRVQAKTGRRGADAEDGNEPCAGGAPGGPSGGNTAGQRRRRRPRQQRRPQRRRRQPVGVAARVVSSYGL